MTTKTRNILLISASAIAVVSLALYLSSKKKFETLERKYSNDLQNMTIEVTDED